MNCPCGTEMPPIDQYGVRDHVCQHCGRVHALVGKAVQITTPPGCERVEALEGRLSFLESYVQASAEQFRRLVHGEVTGEPVEGTE